MNKKLVYFGIGIFILLIFIYGAPAEIKFVGTPPFFEITWNNKEKLETQKVSLDPQIKKESSIPDVTIEKFEPQQEVYSPGDNATVKFTIVNHLGVPYNITVDWLYNGSRYHGWSTLSTSVYNSTVELNDWSSWYYPIPFKGEWEAHIVIKYLWQGQTFPKDKTKKFRVV